MKYYECHITMLANFTRHTWRAQVKHIVEKQNWKFSAIDGDPVLGDGVKCYATTFYNEKLLQETVLKNLNMMAEYLSTFPGIIEVVRRKVELVIFDDRSSKIQDCTGSCGVCLGDVEVK